MCNKICMIGLLVFIAFFSCDKIEEKRDADVFEQKEAIQKEISSVDNNITMKLVGDVLTTRKVYSVMQDQHFRQHFKHVREFLSDADLTFGNLENPLSNVGEAVTHKHPGIVFRAPVSTALSIKDAGFNIMSLANNHIMDYGSEALFETMDILDLLDIAWVGAGRNLAEARKPRILEIKNKKIAFLAYCQKIYGALFADENTPGPPLMVRDHILEDVTALVDNGEADYIFVTLHWGPELITKHDKYQIEWSHDILDAGAHMIIGHHPHVNQGIEFYKGKPIIYSLSNFSFDMDKDWPETYRSMIVSLSFNDKGFTSFKVYPVRIPFYKYYPTMAEGEDAEEILKDIKERSAAYTDSPFQDGDGYIYVDDKVLIDILE